VSSRNGNRASTISVTPYNIFILLNIYLYTTIHVMFKVSSTRLISINQKESIFILLKRRIVNASEVNMNKIPLPHDTPKTIKQLFIILR